MSPNAFWAEVFHKSRQCAEAGRLLCCAIQALFYIRVLVALLEILFALVDALFLL